MNAGESNISNYLLQILAYFWITEAMLNQNTLKKGKIPDAHPLSYFHGDSSACRIREAVLIAAAEEERFPRLMHGRGSLRWRSPTA